MNNTMRLIKTCFFSGILSLLVISTSYAATPHSVQALEHAVTAGMHGKLGHFQEFDSHVKEAIKHASASEKVHADAHTHVSEAIKHLKETVKHGEMGHAVIAVHAKEALKHAERSEKAHADAHGHMTEAVKHLNESVKHAKQGHADKVSEHTQEAVNHIKSIF